MQQHTPMIYDPATGWRRDGVTNADEWRKQNGACAWLFNPWTGDRRDARDVGSDTFGLLIIPPGEPVYAAANIEHNRQDKA